MKKRILIVALVLAIAAVFAGCSGQTNDTVKYEGEKYACLEYPQDIFYYDYNGSNDSIEEEDGIYPIESPQWDMLWNSGDLYCIKNQIDDANSYYANDENYDWYVIIDSDEAVEETASPVAVSVEESESVYALVDKENNLSIFVNEFEKMGSILKVSKDGIVKGTTSIGKYNGEWYWRSEVIDESREVDGSWPEYVQPLPASVDSKIKKAE